MQKTCAASLDSSFDTQFDHFFRIRLISSGSGSWLSIIHVQNDNTFQGIFVPIEWSQLLLHQDKRNRLCCRSREYRRLIRSVKSITPFMHPRSYARLPAYLCLFEQIHSLYLQVFSNKRIDIPFLAVLLYSTSCAACY